MFRVSYHILRKKIMNIYVVYEYLLFDLKPCIVQQQPEF